MSQLKASHKMKPLQITVFGASGFIGRHVVRRLARTGAIIRVPTRDLQKAAALKVMGDVGQIVPLSCSVRNDASVAGVIGQSDAVVNLIGILYEKSRDRFQTMHVEVAARIARSAKESGAGHFVQMSALGADAASRSVYARSKAAGEDAVRTFFPSAVILRPSIVFGAEDSFFNMFSSLAGLSPFLPLIGGGRTCFQPVFVGDVAEAVVRSIHDPAMQGHIYELGGPQTYTFRALLELMLLVTNRKRMLINLPWTVATLQAAFLELMPHPLLTRDQVRLLKNDNVVSSQHRLFQDMRIDPAALEAILPSYLRRSLA